MVIRDTASRLHLARHALVRVFQPPRDELRHQLERAVVSVLDQSQEIVRNLNLGPPLLKARPTECPRVQSKDRAAGLASRSTAHAPRVSFPRVPRHGPHVGQGLS